LKKTAFLIFCLLARGAWALGETPAMLADGVVLEEGLEVRMLDGGFYRAAAGKLYPRARLLFKYVGGGKRFHKNVSVDLVEAAGGRRLGGWNTFVSIRPGKSLDRRYGRESLAAWDKAEDAPALALRVAFKGAPSKLLPLPALERMP
jgi:hypothetical protein